MPPGFAQRGLAGVATAADVFDGSVGVVDAGTWVAADVHAAADVSKANPRVVRGVMESSFLSRPVAYHEDVENRGAKIARAPRTLTPSPPGCFCQLVGNQLVA
jgi:hypothetical protein